MLSVSGRKSFCITIMFGYTSNLECAVAWQLHSVIFKIFAFSSLKIFVGEDISRYAERSSEEIVLYNNENDLIYFELRVSSCVTLDSPRAQFNITFQLSTQRLLNNSQSFNTSH